MAQSPREVAVSWFEQVWNRGDASAIERLMAPDAKFYGLGPEAMSRSDFKAMYDSFRSAFPDIRIEVVRSVAPNDGAAVGIAPRYSNILPPAGRVPRSGHSGQSASIAAIRSSSA